MTDVATPQTIEINDAVFCTHFKEVVRPPDIRYRSKLSISITIIPISCPILTIYIRTVH